VEFAPGVNRKAEANPDREYTSRAESRLEDYRVRSPGFDDRVWAWSPGGKTPDAPFLAAKGSWGLEWDRYSSLTGAEGAVDVHMAGNRPFFLKGEQAGSAEICFDLTASGFRPKNGRKYECSDVEITERDDGGGVGDPGP
jgi:hypothetical protein